MKITITLLVLSLLFSFSKAQQKYPIIDESSEPISYGVSSLHSKIPVFLTTDKQTKSIIPFNAIPNDPLGTMVYLVDATNVSVTTRIKKDSLSYYRYSIFENDTTIVQSNALLSKIDFVWPDRSDFPGYLTMNFGVSQLRNKKITIKIWRLPEESKVTTVIVYNKLLKPAKLTETYLLRKNRTLKTLHAAGPIYRVVNDAIPLKNDIRFNVDQKTLGIYLSMKKTDLDFVYRIHVSHMSLDSANIDFVAFAAEWKYNTEEGNPSCVIDADYFNKPGEYKIYVVPQFGRETNISEVYRSTPQFTFKVLSVAKVYRAKDIVGIIVVVLLSVSFAAGLIIFIVKRRNRHKVRAVQKKADIAKGELDQIRSQLNPHFVYNSLSGIQNLMNQNEVEKANAYLSKFARLTRNILDERELIALQDEQKLLDDYLAMERLRFKFNYEIRLSDEVNFLEVEIPTMLLQPFVENATKHSMSTLRDKGDLLVEFKSVGKNLVLSIQDNGKGFDVHKVHEGLGLTLCRKKDRFTK